jgi:hypothetical protein
LGCDLAANAERLGNRAEAQAYREQYGCALPSAIPAAARGNELPGQVRLFLECGTVPFKRQVTFVAPIYREEIVADLDESVYAERLARRRHESVNRHVELDYLLKVAVPELLDPPRTIGSALVYATGSGGDRPAPMRAVPVADLGAQVRHAFEEKEAQIVVRAVGRALAKYVATRKAEKEGGKLAGRLANVAAIATESADTRCWTTLPDRILMANGELPPGSYRLDVVLMGPDGSREGFVRIPDVVIRSDRATFLSYRVR